MGNDDQKSKVFTLGNRLSKSVSRRDAFIRAWAIVKAGGLKLPVKGVTFGNRQEALKRLTTYDPALLRAFIIHENDNPVDPHAVAVMVGVQGGKGYYRLGYAPKEWAGVFGALSNKSVDLRIVKGSWNYRDREYITFGARFRLAV